MHTDPIADMLTRIRNGCRARHDRVELPASRLKTQIAEILKQEGYIGDYRSISGRTPGQGLLEIKLRYDDRNEPVISDIQRVSKPGLRKYMRCDRIPKVRNGLGVMIMTTSKGLMTDNRARQEGVGGEALCAVW